MEPTARVERLLPETEHEASVGTARGRSGHRHWHELDDDPQDLSYGEMWLQMSLCTVSPHTPREGLPCWLSHESLRDRGSPRGCGDVGKPGRAIHCRNPWRWVPSLCWRIVL